MINSERRIGLTKKVHRAPGEALADFHIFKLIAQYWGCGEMFARWSSPKAAFQILKELSRKMPCDMSGIHDYETLEEHGGIQWPWPEDSATPPRERRLFEDGKFYTPDGRARFIFASPEPLPETASPEFPFILLTGRGSSSQWHTGTRTSKSDILRALAPAECYVEINPADARVLGLSAQEKVQITSRRGSITARAAITATVAPGQIFIPMHYPAVNTLTCPAFDRHSRQPSYKYAAVRIKAMMGG
jgi:assimilatory nitrate reductase catalytic subunit